MMDGKKIGNKIKRQSLFRDEKKRRNKERLNERLERVRLEKKDPEAKAKRLEDNIPTTIERARLPDPLTLPTPEEADQEVHDDLGEDQFSSALHPAALPPKILLTTSAAPCKFTYEFCKDLLSVFPNTEFVPRQRQKGFELPRICAWAIKRQYSDVIVLNEDHKLPNALTVVHLPNGPTAYFKLTNPITISRLHGHARPSKHFPELVLNNFNTRLGHTVGRLFQALFPVMPEFEGRQVATLHNQRDYLFFRRHRYAFRSEEKAQLQEIGPRFTLKLLEMKSGLPVLQHATLAVKHAESLADDFQMPADIPGITQGQDEYIYKLRPEMQKSRRRFYL